MSILDKIIGTHSQRELRRISPTVDAIEALRPTMQALSDEELRAKTDEFKKRLADGETLDDVQYHFIIFVIQNERAKINNTRTRKTSQTNGRMFQTNNRVKTANCMMKETNCRIELAFCLTKRQISVWKIPKIRPASAGRRKVSCRISP